MTTTPKHFAGLIRVSTEQQQKRGESLKVQHDTIERTVEQLGGRVVRWYGGHEHATPGWEKAEINRLLNDAGTFAWDAVIVSNADRWSRDNQSNRRGLDILKGHHIRFFVGATEYDLFNPEHSLFLEMSAAFGTFQARHQNRKSMQSRISRAKQDLPAVGKRPYGRTFDRTIGKWGVDPKKQKLIQEVAKRYLGGESLEHIADELGMSHANLHKTLTKRCGDEWVQRFDSDELNIHEKVISKVPPLLPAKMIKAIQERARANKTFLHGHSKHQYLLARMIFCEACGYAMFGQTNHINRRYYRHAHAIRKRTCIGKRAWVRADAIENAVIRHLFNTFGNPVAAERAIEAAVPDVDKTRAMQDRLAKLAANLGRVKRGRERTARLVASGVMEEAEAEKALNESANKEAVWRDEMDRLSAAVQHIPKQSDMKELAKQVSASFRRRMPMSFVRANATANVVTTDFERMTWEEKRDLVERVFSGVTVDGRRMGVYISWPDDEKIGRHRRFRYTVYGHLVQQSGEGPMADEEAKKLVRPDNVEKRGLTKSALRCRAAALP